MHQTIVAQRILWTSKLLYLNTQIVVYLYRLLPEDDGYYRDKQIEIIPIYILYANFAHRKLKQVGTNNLKSRETANTFKEIDAYLSVQQPCIDTVHYHYQKNICTVYISTYFVLLA